MSSSHRHPFGLNKTVRPAILAILLLVALTGSSLAGEFQRNFKFEAQELELTNLVGEVTVLPASGDQFVVDVYVRGEDAEESLLEFSSKKGQTSTLVLEFPLDEHKKYVYPAMGRGSSASIHYSDDNSDDGSWLRKIFSGLSGTRIKIEGRGRGLEMWADITVKVPEGSLLILDHGVGKISAEDCVADLDLDINSGSITASDIVGTFKADTGSGRVIAENMTGNSSIDTGSGSVKVIGFKGDDLLVDTGSGRVTVERVICEKLDIDTGSGSVEAREVGADQARIDTGSGSVVLQLDRMGTGHFEVDTGSGSVKLFLPENASASIIADTGSGGVDVNFTGAMITSKARDRVEMTVGDGEATVRLDTGSGSIKIYK